MQTVNSMFDTKNTYFAQPRNIKDIKEIMNCCSLADGLKSIDGIKKVGYFEINEKKTNFTCNLGDIDYYILANADMLDIYNLRDSKGKAINGDTFRNYKVQDGLKPIFTGVDLKAEGKSFDISCDDGEKNTYKGIRTLKENYLFPSKDYIQSAPINLNKGVVLQTPDDLDSLDSAKLNAIFSGFFIKTDGESSEKMTEEVIKYFGDKGFNINITRVKDDLNNYLSNYDDEFITQLRITICLTVFSLIGTAITIVMSINKRRRELGIRMATGASKFDLITLIFGEVLLSILISYVIAFSYLLGVNHGVIREIGVSLTQVFNLWFAIIYILCFFTIILLLSFSVIRAILKIQPRDLIGGAK